MQDFLSRISSRKFIVWVTGTLLFLFNDKMQADHWLILCGIFIGGKVLEMLVPKKED